MRIEETLISGCSVLHLDRHVDDRGIFFELFQSTRYKSQLPEFNLLQINSSISHKYTVRGMHYAPYTKVVACLHGLVFDVVVDMRADSPTYRKWVAVDLTPYNEAKQIIVPAGCAHGFMAMEPDSVVVYCQNATYKPGVEIDYNYLDPKFGIEWPKTPYVILSKKDQEAKFLGN
jgi:dTDP-4-dehydrorhamnose 3,5-epimerase